jgi:hypothetical protein
MQKNGEDNQKARKINQIISQIPTFKLKHDKIWARWASDVLLENMLEKV